MSSSLRNRIQCLLCEGKERDTGSCSLSHIHNHLGYKKYACDLCDFSCYAEDDAVVHKFKLSHAVSHNRSEYKEALSNLIYLHCLHAAEFGIKAVVSNGILNLTFPEAGKECQEKQRNFDTRGEEKHEKGKKAGENSAVNRERSRFTSRSSESEKEVSQKQKERGSGSTAEKGGKEQKKKPVFSFSLDKNAWSDDLTDGKALDSHSENRGKGDSHRYLADEQPGPSQRVRSVSAVEERNALLKSKESETLPCRKCKEDVGSSYVERRQHVMTMHLKAEERIKEEVSSAEMRECFPRCAVFSDEQCIECGKVVKSDHGRRNHISTQHFKKTIECVVPGCGLFEATPSDLKKHIEVIHGIPLSSAVSGDVFRLFTCSKKEFDASIAIQMLHYFPFELKRSASGMLTELPSARGIPSTSVSERLQSAFREELSLRSRSRARFPRTPSPSTSDSSVDSLQRILKERRSVSAEDKKNLSSAQNVIAPVGQAQSAKTSVKSPAFESNLSGAAVITQPYSPKKKTPLLPNPLQQQVSNPSTSGYMAVSFDECNVTASSDPVNSCFTSPRNSEFWSSGNNNRSVETPRKVHPVFIQEPSILGHGSDQYRFAFHGNDPQLQQAPGTVVNEVFRNNGSPKLVNGQDRNLSSSNNFKTVLRNESSFHVSPVPSTGNPQKIVFLDDSVQSGLDNQIIRSAQQNFPKPNTGAQNMQNTRPGQNARNSQKGKKQNQPKKPHRGQPKQNLAQQHRNRSRCRSKFQQGPSGRMDQSRNRPNLNLQNARNSQKGEKQNQLKKPSQKGNKQNQPQKPQAELDSFESHAHQQSQHLGQILPADVTKQGNSAQNTSAQQPEVKSAVGGVKKEPLGPTSANGNGNPSVQQNLVKAEFFTPASTKHFSPRNNKSGPRATAPNKRPNEEKAPGATVVRPGQWQGKRKRFNSGGSNGGKHGVFSANEDRIMRRSFRREFQRIQSGACISISSDAPGYVSCGQVRRSFGEKRLTVYCL